MSEDHKQSIENHVSGQHSEGYEAGGSHDHEQNVEAISTQNEYQASASDSNAASDSGHGHATQTVEQSDGVTQFLSEPTARSDQIERVDLDNAVLAGTDNVRQTDKREEVEAGEVEEKSGENQPLQQQSHHGELRNEVRDGYPEDKPDQLQDALVKIVAEEESITQQDKEGREIFAQGVFSLHHQLKALAGQESLLNEDKVEVRDEEAQMANIPLKDVINECSEFAKTTSKERSNSEATIRNLHALLSMKDKEIEYLNTKAAVSLVSHDIAASVASSFNSVENNLTPVKQSNSEATIRNLQALLSMKDQGMEDLKTKVAVLLVSHDVATSVASSFNSIETNSEVQLEKDHNIEIVMDKIIPSIATIVNQDQVLDNSISGKIVHIEIGTSLLIENYKQILSEIDQLGQSFSEVAWDTREKKDFAKNILVAARNELLELKRKETELNEKLAQLGDENQKMVEELDKMRVLTATLNAELERKQAELESKQAELEQEKVNCANTKEKLSKTVTKGKALVQQRDALKQSLANKSNELEESLIKLREKSVILESAEITKEELVRSENMVASLNNSLVQSNTIFEQVREILSETESDKPELLDVQERLRWLVDDRKVLKDAFLEFSKLKDALSLMDMPEPVLSSDLESQINWFRHFFQRATADMNVLHEEISTIKESAQDCIDHMSISLLLELQEKNYLQLELTNLKYKYEETVQKSHNISLEKDQIVKVLVELSGLNMEDHIDLFSSDAIVIINRCFQKIKEQRGPSSEMFERIQSLLYVRDSELLLYEDILEEERLIRSNMNKLSNELKVASEEILALKEEKGSLQKDLERSEEKSAVLRDKLSMAVKKGKGLVQDRDNLKSSLNEKNLEIEQLKNDLKNQESVVSHYRDQINRLSRELESIPKLEAGLSLMQNERNQFEQFLLESNNMLQRLTESIDGVVLPVDLVFEEPVERVKWLAGYVRECLDAKLLAEKDLQLVKEEASVSERILAEAQETVKSLEQTLSSSENSIYQLAEEKRELELGKMKVLEELQKVKEEAAEVYTSMKSLKDTLLQAEKDIYVLSNEKEKNQVSGAVADTGLERVMEEDAPQTSKLAEARKNIEDMENALSEVKSNVNLLTQKCNTDQIIKTNMENELKKWQDEAEHQASKLMDSSETIKSLNNALLKAQDEISILEDANKIAKEEISSLNLKLNSCLDELDGKSHSFENCSVELIGFLNDLQVLIEEDILFPRVKQGLEKKFENLKTMDLLLGNIADHIYGMTGKESKRHLAVQEDLLVRKDFSNELEKFDVKLDHREINDADIDGVISLFGKIVKGFQSRNKLIADKFDDFSACIDELVSPLLAKLQELKIDMETVLEYTQTLKEKVNAVEMLTDKQEKTIATLENDITILSSACMDSTRELQIEIESHVMESGGSSEVERFNNEMGVQANNQQHNKYMETAQVLINATRRTQTLIKQFELRSKEVAATTEDLGNKLNETRADLEMVIKERDLYKKKSVQLESDIQALQGSCRGLTNDLEDYHALEVKLKEKEAEISSLYSTLSTKEQEMERSLLLSSQERALFGKIDKIEIPLAESEDLEPHTSAPVKKLFHIVDCVTRLQHHVSSLSHDKEELQSTLDNEVLEVKHLKEEVKRLNINREDSKDGKKDESELTFALEKILDMLGASDWTGDKKSAGAKGLITVLKKQVTNILLESEKSKSREQELSSNLHGSQKVIDELTTRVKLLEQHSLQDRTSQPEIRQERSIFEVASLPVISDISEIEEGSIGKKATSVQQAAHVRNMRKGSTDHLALDIDSESDSLINRTDIDEKGHLFKSLNTTGFVPKRGKFIADSLDGIWVSCGQVLMSRPKARLGVISYLLILHVWLLGTIL